MLFVLNRNRARNNVQKNNNYGKRGTDILRPYWKNEGGKIHSKCTIGHHKE
jgi:hypothetical protein